MAKVLLNVRWEDGTPTVSQVCERFGFAPEELDERFGVVEIDPHENLFSVLVERSAVERVAPEWGDAAKDVEGPFSNPPIEPFGPPEP